jgi:DNA-binding LytR/AlgR family response regulator
MPGEMNGIELAREIARSRPGLPVVLTTGFSPAAQAATREGLPLLPKPYSIDSLAEVLAAARGA